MDPDLVAVLRCPVCADALALTGRTARCAQGHAYDLAKQGYLNLLPSASNGIEGDSAGMIGARTVFLGGGHYAPIRDALILRAAEYLQPDSDELVVEVGAGTGYYLSGVTGRSRPGLALDVSRYAARRAAKVDPRIGSVVCDAWRELPVVDGAAQVVLNVFAPRNATEMARILRPDGVLLVVTPNPEHLEELIGVLGMVSVDQDKERRLQDALGGTFVETGREVIAEPMRLDRTAVEQLVLMTPSARHIPPHELATRVSVLPEPTIATLSVTLTTWHPRPVL
ncbi:methyltransferase domain-containing protein [Kribbella albertanoniae]|uniref:Methyltransferase type 11 n=1 Tax=Kribbella albertanoniae TaxID=1266829 RepID=A0A4R4NXX4_9ACTN|nr:methyltransferase domain-containing protein [Kribbella albertanoniae]TDC14369.1 methyltransferase type 11 [Kribbella albertanoniae]